MAREVDGARGETAGELFVSAVGGAQAAATRSETDDGERSAATAGVSLADEYAAVWFAARGARDGAQFGAPDHRATVGGDYFSNVETRRAVPSRKDESAGGLRKNLQ